MANKIANLKSITLSQFGINSKDLEGLSEEEIDRVIALTQLHCSTEQLRCLDTIKKIAIAFAVIMGISLIINIISFLALWK